MHLNDSSLFYVLTSFDVICSPNNRFITKTMVSFLFRWLYNSLEYSPLVWRSLTIVFLAKENSIAWNLQAITLDPLITKSWKRNLEIGFRKRMESYSIAFLFAASIIILATYSSILTCQKQMLRQLEEENSGHISSHTVIPQHRAWIR